MHKEPEPWGSHGWAGEGAGTGVMVWEDQMFWFGPVNSGCPLDSEQLAAHANLELCREVWKERVNLCVQQIKGFNHGTR